ncbi:MAG: oligosaccharide flippase family protein, partial [Clostridia bacterium]|nr:oligosaccharide flippase family protein [Clostridia bacterium]
MKRQSLKGQAALLTCVNALVRGLGFILHVVLSRMLGAEALGVMELSHSAHMLSITPVTAGLPAAVSRLTAVRRDSAALRAGRGLALRMSAVLIPLWVILSPVVAYLLGDERTLLPLWVFTPCIAVLGLTAVYSGYCYGWGSVWPPALGTLLEQALRFGVSAALLLLLP